MYIQPIRNGEIKGQVQPLDRLQHRVRRKSRLGLLLAPPSVVHGYLRILLGLYAFMAIVYVYAWFFDNIDIYHPRDVTEPEYTLVIGLAAIGRSFSYFTYLSYSRQGFYFIIIATHGFFDAILERVSIIPWPLSWSLFRSGM
jgi:hypothetical protein